MSQPPNILSTYRSHSYYHVLALCDRSATAEALTKLEDDDAWTRQNDNGEFGKWTPQTIEKLNMDDGQDGYYSILIHGGEDADMGITSFKLTAYTAASATATDKSTSIATEGELVIVEPKGVVLFDLMVLLMNKMKANSASMCFVIKTFFVGHGYDEQRGGEYSDTITTVAPSMLLLADAQASYSESGSVYTMQVIALSNGASRLPQFSRAADGASIHLDKALSSRVTVKEALTTLFDVIRRNYDRYYDCVIAISQSKGIKDPEKTYYKVKYEIEVDDCYGDKKYIITDAPDQYKTHGGDCQSPPSIKAKPGSSIEDIIHQIMGVCPAVQRDMTEGEGNGENAIKYEYKIHSTVVTYYEGDTKRQAVRYSVRKFVSPRGFNVKQLMEGKSGDTPETQDAAKRLHENLIIFDYIFSGKNIDILEFDIKMAYGLAYMQTATTSNSFKDQLETVASRTHHVSMHSDPSGTTGEQLPIPVFFAPQLRGLTANNTNEPGSNTQAIYNMSKHASIEMAEASMVIVGNPMLYSTVSKQTHPSSVTASPPTVEPGNNKLSDAPTLEYANFKYWSQMPALAQVNIYMPARNDDVGLMSGAYKDDTGKRIDYAKKFWYDGYYYVYGIEHMFVEGEFKQRLLMVALPNGPLLESGKLKSETEETTSLLRQCTESLISDAPAPASPSTAPFSPSEPKAKQVEPTTKQDADVVSSSAAGDPSKVKHWNTKASSDVKQAIKQASAQTGVDSTILAQFALIESSYNPSAKALTSSATGLYQHIDGTWMGLVRKGLIPGIPSNTTESEALQKRLDPNYSALGGAVLLQQNAQYIKSTQPGDLYLAHFAGMGGAKKIIDACNAGKGNASLEEIFGDRTAAKMKNANPHLRNMDAQGVRNWAATKMANTIEGGVPTTASATVPPPKQGSQTPPKPVSPETPLPTGNKKASDVLAEIKTKNAAATNPTQKTEQKTEQTKEKKPCGTKVPEPTPIEQQGGGP